MEKSRFFGLHMDFHARNDVEIGYRTSEEDMEWLLENVKPDFVQVDCKGHPGNSCYPTKVGHPADGLVADNLKILCDAANKHGVPIYAHFSGLWDIHYQQNHPEELPARLIDGEIVKESSPISPPSVFGNYYKDYMIPQIKELIDNYNLAGVWIDGDLWKVIDDYSELTHGIIPEGLSENEHKKFVRDYYMKQFKNYVDEIHRYKPDFEVITNWTFSSYMPEVCCVDVDYLSGDSAPSQALEKSMFGSTIFSVQNKKWDLLSWGSWSQFDISKGTSLFARFSAPQIMQESAVIISKGGGYQFIVHQNNDGSIRKDRNQTFIDVAKFANERRFLYNKKPVSQVGIYYSATSQYNKLNNGYLYSYCGSSPIYHLLNCVIDTKYTADYILEGQDYSKYEIVIVSEWEFLSDDEKKAFVEYAQAGGKLVIMGAQLCKEFESYTGNTFGDVIKDANYSIYTSGNISCIVGDILDLVDGDGVTYFNFDSRDVSSLPAYKKQSLGKGEILFIPFNLASAYGKQKICYTANYLQEMLELLAPQNITVNNKAVIVTATEDETYKYVSIINKIVPSGCVYDYVPPLYDLEVEIKGSYKDVEMPFNDDFTYELTDDKVTVNFKKLAIHSVIKLRK